MVRFFSIRINYNSHQLLAKVIEQHLSPSTFHITFQQQSNVDLPGEIILQTKNGKLELADNSTPVNDEILGLVSTEIEEYLRTHPLSSDFRI